jgi:hypothetical protein
MKEISDEAFQNVIDFCNEINDTLQEETILSNSAILILKIKSYNILGLIAPPDESAAIIATDTRIAYGVRCSWWDEIQNVKVLNGLPVCPHCGSPLFEKPDMESFMVGADEFEAEHPGYMKLLAFAKGKCFTGIGSLQAAYDKYVAEQPRGSV